MKAIERHRQTWQGKSDEWLFERLDNELKQKVEEIHRLLAENEALRQFDVISRLFSEVENEFKVKGVLFMTYRKESDVLEFYEVDENEEKVEKYLKRVSINDL